MAKEQKIVMVGEVRAIKETEKALLVVASHKGVKTTPGCEKTDQEVWVAKKAIDESSEVKDYDQTGILAVKEWYALLNKWPGYEQGLPERKTTGSDNGSPGVKLDADAYLQRLSALEKRVAAIEAQIKKIDQVPF
jgi:hypothetical protein